MVRISELMNVLMYAYSRFILCYTLHLDVLQSVGINITDVGLVSHLTNILAISLHIPN